MIVTGGAALLPACVKNIKQVSLDLKNLKITPTQEDLLAEIANVIIPTTDTPGAKELNLHQFILRMVDDCFEPEEQEQFLIGLTDFDKMSEEKTGNSFLDLGEDKKERLLAALEGSRNSDHNEEKEKTVNKFYSTVKNLTVYGYTTSEYVMTNQLYYNMIPGRFIGCVEVKDAKDYKTILG